MSMHTKEPWGVTRCFCGKPECNNYTLDQASAGGWLSGANARRLVACVNACADVSDHQLGLIEKTGGVRALLERNVANAINDAKVEQKRDALLAAAKSAYSYLACIEEAYEEAGALSKAIASVEGGEQP